ncbi:Regulator of chromosome condensation, RCC1 [Beauveria brongniartii RCEF 3172]|uniref:Regulator of chromosome condensation, RCC1 n=1 Tax=Beauveria brongniartii RCEF 3172 TaxID=1081107 RepID=A0A162I0L0_9HYPO|nr:Regulator of chromosome condensation, RCC1 [Beauveria brongniartii RCEF 3172]
MTPSTVDLGGLQTENRNPRTTTIDKVSTEELCRILHEEDCRVPVAVTPCLPEIAATIDTLTERVRKGGRVFYVGAGTSGRLGVLDASEIPPTYSTPPNQFIALIAGGDYALRNAKEGAEDDRSAAKTDLDAFNIAPNLDSLIGIASSGRTPYVLGGLEYARSIGCTTVGVVCVQPSAIATEGNADYLISAVTGSESVTGSTRMKAGTATKLVLNMISTGIMIKLGKTWWI